MPAILYNSNQNNIKERNNMKFPIALQLYTVRDEMEADFAGTLKKVKEMGYEGEIGRAHV